MQYNILVQYTWPVWVTGIKMIKALFLSLLTLTRLSRSFLASSGNAVYKVTPADDKCIYANLTCNPKVSRLLSEILQFISCQSWVDNFLMDSILYLNLTTNHSKVPYYWKFYIWWFNFLLVSNLELNILFGSLVLLANNYYNIIAHFYLNNCKTFYLDSRFFVCVFCDLTMF